MSLLLTIVRLARYPAFDFVSPLPRDECVRRLREKTDPFKRYSTVYVGGCKIYETPLRVNPKPLTGYIGENDLHIAKQLKGGMSVARLFGEIIDGDGKTRLHCFVGVHPVVVVFFAFWFSFLFFGFVRIGPDTITTIRVEWFQYAYRGFWAASATLLLMLAFGVGLVVWCRTLYRNEKDPLVDFVRKTLEAQKV